MRGGPAAPRGAGDRVELEPGGEPDRRAGRALWTDSRPSVGIGYRRARLPAVRSRKRIPSVPAERDVDRRGHRRRRRSRSAWPGRPCARSMPVTIGSSAFSTAVPSAGSASSSSPLACSTASIVPIRDRWTRLDRGHDADRRPRHRGEVGDLARHVHAHLEHRRLVLRAEAQERQRQPDLVVLVALALERPPGGAEDRRDRLLRRRLGDAAGDPDDERVEPARASRRPPRRGPRAHRRRG